MKPRFFIIFNHINSSLYHYAGNNPVRYVDPDGREDEVGQAALFNQQQWTEEEGFDSKFANSACAATACLNAVSVQYTKEKGEALLFDDAKTAMKSARDSGKIDSETATVLDWSGAANAMAGALGMNGTFTANEKDPDYKIFAFADPLGELTEPVHFSLVSDRENNKFFDSWDGVEKGWALDGMCGGEAGLKYRACPLQQGRPIRGLNYKSEENK